MRLIPTVAMIVAVLVTGTVPAVGQQTIVGVWVKHGGDGNRMVFTFRNDGTGSWGVETTGDQPFSDKYEFHYSIDLEEDPGRIDIFEIDHGPLVGKVVYGVVGLDGDDAILMDIATGPPGDDSGRPADLSGQRVARLERIGTR